MIVGYILVLAFTLHGIENPSRMKQEGFVDGRIMALAECQATAQIAGQLNGTVYQGDRQFRMQNVTAQCAPMTARVLADLVDSFSIYQRNFPR